MLTEQFALNHNAVRQHLAKLRDAGLVTEVVAPRAGPGRPPLEYRVAPAAELWISGGPYKQLAMMLLELHNTGRSPREIGAEVGRRSCTPDSSTTFVVDYLAAEMARRGFQPQVDDSGDPVELVLRNCPFSAAADASPQVVCELHRGLAEGVADAFSPEATIVDLVIRPPQEGNCRLRIGSRRAVAGG